MESLALLVVIVLFTSVVGGPVAILLTYLPNKPTYLRVSRTIAVIVLSLVGIFFGVQLAVSSGVPAFPRLIGFTSVITSVTALLFEFKILKHKYQIEMVPTGKDIFGREIQTQDNKNYSNKENTESEE